MAASPRRVSVVLFEGFELLDVFGPVELLSKLPGDFAVNLLGPVAGPVRSSQGTEVIAEAAYADAPAPDIVMVPGGTGTRALVRDAGFLSWLSAWAQPAGLVASVCTGSALLAAAGLLDGYQATSNKLAFEWASSQGHDVTWAAKDVKRRFLAYSFPPRSPDPPHLAVPERPGFVRAAPALPAATRIRLPSATTACCDRPQAKVSHLHSDQQRLTAQYKIDAHPLRGGPWRCDGKVR